MKKHLLMAFAALLCAVGMSAQGTGTIDDPIVVSDGSTYTVPAGQTVYAQLEASSAGTLTLVQNTWSQLGFNFTDGTRIPVAYGLSSSGIGFRTTIDAAGTYVFYNTSTQGSDVTVTVGFEGTGASAVQLNMIDPEAGTAFDVINADTRITAYLNQNVDHVVAALFDDDDDNVYYQLTATLDEVDKNVVYVTYEWGEIPMYQGHNYRLRLQCYLTSDASEQPQVINVNYTGTQEAAIVTNINVLSVTPEPGVSYPTEDQMLNFAAGRNTVTVEFDGEVIVSDVKINEGYGMSTPVDAFTALPNELGHTVLVATIPSIFRSQTDIILAFAVTDADGNATEDTGEYGHYKTENYYSFDIAVADGRVVNYGLTPTSVTPANGGYVTELSAVTLSFSVSGDYAPVRALNNANGSLYLMTSDTDSTLVANAAFAAAGEGLDNTDIVVTFTDPTTGEDKTIEANGTYKLHIGQMSIGDNVFDEVSPWTPGYGGAIGSCNPALEYTYQVVSSIAEVVSVDPATYVEGGEYSTAIPSTINVTFSESGVNVSSAYFSLGMGRREMVPFELNGNVLTLNVPESAQSLRSLTVVVAATSEAGVPINYCNDDPELSLIMLNYQLTPAVFLPTEVSPADGSTVEQLSDITLTVSDEYNVAISPVTTDIYVYTADGQLAALGAINYPDDWNIMNQVIITLTPAITAEGTYTLVIPENTFMSLDETIYNPQLTYTYTVDSTVGISSVATEGTDAAQVFTIAGVKVAEGAKDATLSTLKPGLYIVNGKKLVVK